jgi:hypothetical protein|nr:MAG TPA: KAP family P-loop domain [Caudoviricetes sp.]
MTIKELIQVLENCEEDAEVYLGCTTGPGKSTALEACDIYERKDNEGIYFDFYQYLFVNELEEKFYGNQKELEVLREIKEVLDSDWM